MNEEYPIIVKSYDLTLWYIKKLSSLPKEHRFTIAEKVQNSLLELLMLLTDAIYTKEKRPLLLKANREIEKLRLLTRLLRDLELLSKENARFVSDALLEIGQMLGGWMKGVRHA